MHAELGAAAAHGVRRTAEARGPRLVPVHGRGRLLPARVAGGRAVAERGGHLQTGQRPSFGRPRIANPCGSSSGRSTPPVQRLSSGATEDRNFQVRTVAGTASPGQRPSTGAAGDRNGQLVARLVAPSWQRPSSADCQDAIGCVAHHFQPVDLPARAPPPRLAKIAFTILVRQAQDQAVDTGGDRGRPTRPDRVVRRRTSWRCQCRIVAGVTRNPWRWRAGSTRRRAVITGSFQLIRGRGVRRCSKAH
jgi:hypothetical protein